MGKTKEELAELDAELGELAGGGDAEAAGSQAAAEVGTLDEVDEQLAALSDGADVDVAAAKPAVSSGEWDNMPTDVQDGGPAGASAEAPTEDLGSDEFELLVDEDILEIIDDD